MALPVAVDGIKKARSTVDRDSAPPHHDLVGLLSNDERLCAALIECLRSAGVSTALARTLLPDILAKCEEVYSYVRDPLTGLTIPIKPPAQRYVDRPRPMSLGEYVEEQWPDHLEAGLLFFEDIFRVAPDLHRACRFHADQNGQSVHDFVKAVGILSRPVMAQDAERYQRQLNLLKALEQMNQAKTRLKTAHDLLDCCR